MGTIPQRADIVATEAVIRPYIRETPVLVTPPLDFGLSGQPLTFKLEYLQHSGTFKARGAFANLLMRGGAEQGVVAASGGNHGAAVAYAAKTLGRRARIFVPSIASAPKVEKIRGYGAELVIAGDRYVDAYAASQEWLSEKGGLMVHAYDEFHTLAGQGTVALELQRQAPDLDTVLVAVGGGGLIGGMAAAYASAARLVGVEPENAPTLERALAAGKPVEVSVSGVAADSLGASRIGDLAFAIAKDHVAGTVLVSDRDIEEAQRTLWDTLRIVVEPGGAAAFAALLSGRYRPGPEERIGVVLCGANTSAVTFSA